MLPRMDRSFSAVPNHLKAYAYSLQICFAFYIWFLNQYLPYSPVSTLRNGEKEKNIYKKKERDMHPSLQILQVASLTFFLFFPFLICKKSEAWIFSENIWKLLFQVCDRDHWKRGGKCSCSYLEADSFEGISGFGLYRPP